MCYLLRMDERTEPRAGLRELRQNASELVRRAERGEHIVITVSGRDVASLGPATGSRRWLTWEDLADVLRMTIDDDWSLDRSEIDQEIVDPWER
jgi:prevent-host-death family protein